MRPLAPGVCAATHVCVLLLAGCLAARGASEIELTDLLRADPTTGSLEFSAGPTGQVTAKTERVQIGLLLDRSRDGSSDAPIDQLDPKTFVLTPGFPKVSDTQSAFTGVLGTSGQKGAFSFTETLAHRAPGEVSLSLEVGSSTGIWQKALCLNLLLSKPFIGRAVTFDGKPVVLPGKFGDPCLFFTPIGRGVRHIEIPGVNGVLEVAGENLDVLFCQYANGMGSIRLYLARPRTDVVSGKIDITLKTRPYAATPVDIRAAANRAFHDEVADDQKGGWTDQGPRNDLTAFPVGKHRFGNVEFDIIDPASNLNRSCLVFGNADRRYFPKTSEITFTKGPLAYLYLLHATAWSPLQETPLCGTITIQYQDGSRQQIEVRSNRDVADWWSPHSTDNAVVVWRDKTPGGQDIGLYLSRFKLEDRKIARITLTSAGNAVWMVAGMSAVEDSAIPVLPFEQEASVCYVTEPDENWAAFDWKKDIAKGSALDFSFLQDAPAGKYGPVVIKDGVFAFRDRPDKPVRFFGTNLVTEITNDLTKEQSEELATRLAAMGYNAVRLHHFDDGLIKSGATTPELDPEHLDRMDYLVYCLKERGIYIVTDLYVSRLKGFDRKFDNLTEVKFAAAFIPEVRDNLKAFARNLLTHVNPYTKRAYKDEPALATLAMINEDALATHYTLDNFLKHPYLREAFDKALASYCASLHLSAPASPSADPALLSRFLMETQTELYKDLRANVRSIGAHQPTTDMNHRALYVMELPRSTFDFVENHLYHDHPDFTGTPFASDTVNDDKSGLQSLGEFLRHGVARNFGKPYMVTEWNFCYPNSHRSESGPIMAGYAALQSWDGLFRFEYSGLVATAFGKTHTWAFNTACDPMQLLSDRIGAMLFLRRDADAAKSRYTFAVTPDIWKLPFASEYLHWETNKNAWFPESFALLGTYGQIGSNLDSATTPLPPVTAAVTAEALSGTAGLPVFSAHDNFAGELETAGLLAATAFRPDQGRFLSETRQIEADTKQTSFKVVTPRSECLVQEGPALEGALLRTERNTSFSTVFASSLDSHSLQDSQRILILHLTDIRNSNEKRTETRGKIIIARNSAKVPLLMKRGSTEVYLKRASQRTMQVWALSMNGERLHPVPFSEDSGSVHFTASTFDAGNPMAYEVTWSAN